MSYWRQTTICAITSEDLNTMSSVRLSIASLAAAILCAATTAAGTATLSPR
jgi:hypothetical protein